jgi:hypothetical protein
VTITRVRNAGRTDSTKPGLPASGTAAHDVHGGLHSLALFGKPGHQPDALLRYSDEPIPQALIDEAAATFRLEVLPSTAL